MKGGRGMAWDVKGMAWDVKGMERDVKGMEREEHESTEQLPTS